MQYLNSVVIFNPLQLINSNKGIPHHLMDKLK